MRERWYIYMLRCADGTLYTGIARDLTRRLAEHNGQSGRGAKYTRSRRPVALVYRKMAWSRSTALRREAALKKLSRSEKEVFISRPA